MNLKYAKRSEDTEQILVIEWSNANMQRYPELIDLYHIPNGGKRNQQEAKKLKQMGVKSGIADLHLPHPKGKYHGLFIEMKYGDNVATKEQKAFLKRMMAAGFCAVISYGAQATVSVLESYCLLNDGDKIEDTVTGCDVSQNREGILIFK